MAASAAVVAREEELRRRPPTRRALVAPQPRGRPRVVPEHVPVDEEVAAAEALAHQPREVVRGAREEGVEERLGLAAAAVGLVLRLQHDRPARVGEQLGPVDEVAEHGSSAGTFAATHSISADELRARRRRQVPGHAVRGDEAREDRELSEREHRREREREPRPAPAREREARRDRREEPDEHREAREHPARGHGDERQREQEALVPARAGKGDERREGRGDEQRERTPLHSRSCPSGSVSNGPCHSSRASNGITVGSAGNSPPRRSFAHTTARTCA
jgi:hypothetical protein